MRGSRSSVYFATGNRAKYLEAAQIAATYGIHLRHLRLAKQEIQAQWLTEIVTFAAKQAEEATQHAVVCEDAGFFVKALMGFPGPYSSYVFKTLGINGIMKLMTKVKNRAASFSSAVAYCEPGHRSVCFTGTVKGVVSTEPRGSYGFGFDPIFVPSKGDGRTFAEMQTHEKNAFSHRANAFKRFSKWFKFERRISHS